MSEVPLCMAVYQGLCFIFYIACACEDEIGDSRQYCLNVCEDSVA